MIKNKRGSFSHAIELIREAAKSVSRCSLRKFSRTIIEIIASERRPDFEDLGFNLRAGGDKDYA